MESGGGGGGANQEKKRGETRSKEFRRLDSIGLIIGFKRQV